MTPSDATYDAVRGFSRDTEFRAKFPVRSRVLSISSSHRFDVVFRKPRRVVLFAAWIGAMTLAVHDVGYASVPSQIIKPIIARNAVPMASFQSIRPGADEGLQNEMMDVSVAFDVVVRKGHMKMTRLGGGRLQQPTSSGSSWPVNRDPPNSAEIGNLIGGKTKHLAPCLDMFVGHGHLPVRWPCMGGGVDAPPPASYRGGC